MPDPSKPCSVVFLHGILRTALAMRPLERAFAADGYATANLTYPRRLAIKDLAAWVHETLVARALPAPLGFVTHSMGGIVMRAYLSRPDALATTRAVMIAPPNRGAVEADKAIASLLRRTVLGPAIYDLATTAPQLPPPPCPFAVIAGGNGVGYARRLTGDNDGRVLVNETRLDGMAAFLLVPRRHTFIMQAPEVIAAARAFITNGRW